MIKSLTFLLSILLSVAFVTLWERKILSYAQSRKGPNLVGFLGILQPFSDGLKLLTKEKSFWGGNSFLLSLSPLFFFLISLMNWTSLPLSGLKMSSSLLCLLVLSSLGGLFIFLTGWNGGSSYSFMGGVRASAQMISYEVVMSFFLLASLSMFFSFSYSSTLMSFFFSEFGTASFFFLPCWMLILLAETNRAPFDLTEGESELVSGFNTEYSSFPFTLLFLGEYTFIIFFSFLTSLLFFGSFFGGGGLCFFCALITKMFSPKTLWFFNEHDLSRNLSDYSFFNTHTIFCNFFLDKKVKIICGHMFIVWKGFSWMIIGGVVISWVFFTLESPLILWFFLEGGVWGTFFFFLGGEEEEKSKISMSFFIIQGLSSLIWIALQSFSSNLSEILIPIIIFLKMGLIPGHFWAWKIYENGNLYLIWIISIFQKILPLGMILFSLECSGLSNTSFKILMVLNMLGLCYLMKKEMNLNLFFLISSMLHFNNMVLLLMNEKILEMSYYFLSYSSLLLFTILFSLSYGKSLISLEGGGLKSGEGAWMLGALSIAGFPPSLMFFVKILMMINMGNVIQSSILFFFAIVFLIYLSILISSFIQFIHFSSVVGDGKFFYSEKGKKTFTKPLNFFLFCFSFLVFLLVTFSLLVLEMKKVSWPLWDWYFK